MINLIHQTVCFYLRAVRAGIFTLSVNNSAVSALVFIPSGGRVGAARLSRQLAMCQALYRV